MTDSLAWTVSVSTASPGWLSIPDIVSGDERDSWIAEARGAFQELHGDAWTSELSERYSALLESALIERHESFDTHMFLVFTLLDPSAVPVRVMVLPNEVAPDFAVDRGIGTVAPVSSPIGPGLRWNRVIDVQEDDRVVQVANIAYAFRGAESTVLVTTGDTLAVALGLIMPALDALVQSLDVRTASDEAFVAIPAAGFSEVPAWEAFTEPESKEVPS